MLCCLGGGGIHIYESNTREKQEEINRFPEALVTDGCVTSTMGAGN